MILSDPHNLKTIPTGGGRVRICSAWASVAAILAILGSTAHAEPATLKVMTYNIRYAQPLPPNSWLARRPILRELIQHENPDVFGVQEALFPQVKDLLADLPEYDWIGLGRDGGSQGEFMAIFYRKQRFEILAFDHYWLSDTPDVIASSTWGNANRRMVTWARLRDRVASQTFTFVDTHFDHVSARARAKSAELVLRRCRAFRNGEPTILVGDFNAAAGSSEPYRALTGEDAFRDAYDEAKKLTDQVRTFNGFRYPAPKDGERIDWILYRGPLQPRTIATIPFAKGNQYPSDHFPVVATFDFVASK